jgi:hypothetical protein
MVYCMTETNLCPLGQRSGNALLIRELQLCCPALVRRLPRGDALHLAVEQRSWHSGKYVIGILLQDPRAVDGMNEHVVSDWITPGQIVDTITKVSGTESQIPGGS